MTIRVRELMQSAWNVVCWAVAQHMVVVILCVGVTVRVLCWSFVSNTFQVEVEACDESGAEHGELPLLVLYKI